jgi:hypothetical protein
MGANYELYNMPLDYIMVVLTRATVNTFMLYLCSHGILNSFFLRNYVRHLRYFLILQNNTFPDNIFYLGHDSQGMEGCSQLRAEVHQKPFRNDCNGTGTWAWNQPPLCFVSWFNASASILTNLQFTCQVRGYWRFYTSMLSMKRCRFNCDASETIRDICLFP